MKFISGCYPKWLGFVACSTIIISLTVCSCKPKSTADEQPGNYIEQDTLPGDFVEFFDQFHADTAFQLAHITFPLEGLPNSQGDADTIPILRYFWQKENWTFHRPLNDPSQQFDNWFEVLDPRIIEHWINMKGTNLFLQRRFAKLSDGWYLIYYAGMRPRDKVIEQ